MRSRRRKKKIVKKSPKRKKKSRRRRKFRASKGGGGESKESGSKTSTVHPLTSVNQDLLAEIFHFTSNKEINRFFTKEYKPYIIGKIIPGKSKIKLNEKINWS